MSSAYIAAPKTQAPSRQPEIRAQHRAARVLEGAQATLAPPPSGTNAMHGESLQTLPKASPPSGANATPGESSQQTLAKASPPSGTNAMLGESSHPTLPKASPPSGTNAMLGESSHPTLPKAPPSSANAMPGESSHPALAEAPPPGAKAAQARRPQTLSPPVDGFASPAGRPASDGSSVSPGTSVSDGGSVSPGAEAGIIENIKAMVASGDAFSTVQNINHTISALTHVKTGLAKRKMEVGHDARVDQKKAKCIEKTNIAIENENKQLAELQAYRGSLICGPNTSMKAKHLRQVDLDIDNHKDKVAKLEAELARHTASTASS